MSTAREFFLNYSLLNNSYDELINQDGHFHPHLAPLADYFNSLNDQQFRSNQRMATSTFRRGGITFTVYSDKRGTEKIFPFDLIPRIISNQEWNPIERGIKQRTEALNAFLRDIYHQGEIFKAKKISKRLVTSSSGYLKQLRNISPPGGTYIHIAGIDLIKDAQGRYLVLEDNVRTPSGVSYVLENRFVMKRLFPDLFSKVNVRPVHEYPLQLRRALKSLAREAQIPGISVVLTPGSYNSAYFEHSFLARQMGCDLVKGQDLFVEDNKVYLKTTRGPILVSVIYRRIDDLYLDPDCFNPGSLLGVPGLMQAYAKGNVVLANAPGNGVADDKAVYPYVPEMIRFYLNEEPILEQVETYSCANNKECEHVIKNLSRMVVKATDGAGGYGMLIGHEASESELAEFRERIRANPRQYIAQPLVNFSTCPTYTNKGLQAKRVDLRPFVITDQSPWVLPGGLTRVALNQGSYVVNSSQGGGSKDTWVLID